MILDCIMGMTGIALIALSLFIYAFSYQRGLYHLFYEKGFMKKSPKLEIMIKRLSVTKKIFLLVFVLNIVSEVIVYFSEI
jgi:hypothetical protein